MGLAYSAALGAGAAVAPPFPRRGGGGGLHGGPSGPPREEALLLAAPRRGDADAAQPSLLARALKAAVAHDGRLRLRADAGAAAAADAEARAQVGPAACEGLREVRFGAGGVRGDARNAGLVVARHARTLRSLAFVGCLDLGDGELLRLGACGNLVSLTLDGCVQITDDGIRGIGELGARLRRLSLKGCKQLVRVGAVVGRLARLETLSLECCVGLEDEELAVVLQQCTALRVLCVAHCFRVTSRAFLAAWTPACGTRGCGSTLVFGVHGNRVGQVRATSLCCEDERRILRDSLCRFVKLDLRCTQVDDALWPVLADMVRLRCLLLGGTNISDAKGEAGISILSRLGDLRQLGVERTVVGDGVLAAAEMLPNLETLDLAYAPISDMGIARYVSKMRELRWLSLEETAVTDYALERLAGLTELRHLDLGDTTISSFGLRALAPLAKLKSINLSFTDVRCCKGLSPLVSLESVCLSGEQRLEGEGLRVGDEALTALSALPRLRELELYSTRITDAGLAEFCNTPAASGLVLLDVCCCGGIGDVAAREGISRLRQLEELNLSQTAVSDRGIVAVLSALPRLVALNVSYTDITQTAIDAAHVHATLQRVAVQGCVIKTPLQPRTSVTPSDALAPVLRLVGT